MNETEANMPAWAKEKRRTFSSAAVFTIAVDSQILIGMTT
jgi:hypothetical protein